MRFLVVCLLVALVCTEVCYGWDGWRKIVKGIGRHIMDGLENEFEIPRGLEDQDELLKQLEKELQEYPVFLERLLLELGVVRKFSKEQ